MFLDHHREKPWAMKVVFDGLHCNRVAAHWIVDALVSAADVLDRQSAS